MKGAVPQSEFAGLRFFARRNQSHVTGRSPMPEMVVRTNPPEKQHALG